MNTFREFLDSKRQYIDWNDNYGKTFKVVHTPEGRQSSGKWSEDLVSVVTPENQDAWTQWKEVDSGILDDWKKNWNEIQKSLGDHKYEQIIRSQDKVNEQAIPTPPNPVGYSPQYNVTPQQAVGHVYQVAKILDPTGVLSYEDIPPAVDNFNNQPTSFNALMMLLAFTAAIPLAGKIAAPLKIAVKAGNYNKVIQITPYVARKIIELVEKNSGNLSRLNIPPETIQRAKQMVQAAKAEEMMPASVFNQMVRDFKAGGGQITKADKGIGSSYTPSVKKIQIEPYDRTRATFAHEYGHHLASNTPGTIHSATSLLDHEKLKPGLAQDAATEFSKTGSIDSTQKKLGLWKGLAKEREANTMAINAMKKFGATPNQIAAYERALGPAFRTYKIAAGRDVSRLGEIITKNLNLPLPPEGKDAVKNMISLADMETFARIQQQPGLLQKLDADPVQYTVIRHKFLDQVLKQKAATDDVYKLIYKEYKKALSTVDDTTEMLKPKGIGLSNATTFNYNNWIRQGGTIGNANKPTKEGIKDLLNHLEIRVKEDQINSNGIKELFSNKENKQKLLNFLNKEPITIKKFPEFYIEIKDGNHRYELAKLAGIEDIPIVLKENYFNSLVNAIIEKSVHDPVRPGILKRQVKGKMTCSKARGIKSRQKNKGNHTAKAAQRYLNYHC